MQYNAAHLNSTMGAMAHSVQEATASVGHGGAGSSQDLGAQGDSALKPKKEITSVTAADAKTLMMELDSFLVDLGELGIVETSEAAYRQLRAMCVGKARDVLDLEVENASGKALKSQLDAMAQGGAPRAQRDYVGARLFMHCVQQLELSVRLTPAKRI